MPVDHAPINWGYLSRTVDHFVGLGYKYIEVPWIVPPETTRITRPERSDRFATGYGSLDLVGSAEQSFLYLDSQGLLGNGCFVACSPCFRHESVVDRTHQIHFMKVELYINDDTLTADVVSQALDWFVMLSGNVPDIALEQTEEGVDILLNGIEVGSYGRRSHGDLNWIYATAIAEPRFSLAMSLRDA